jgi:signal transduction histidine kinase
MPPPALSRRQSAWRYAAALAISTASWTDAVGYQARDYPLLVWVDLALGAASFVAVRYRRRYPLPVALALIALTAVASTATGPALLALVSLATRRRWREIIPAALLNLPVVVVYLRLYPDPDAPLMIGVGVLVTGIAVAIGMYVGARRELLASLRDRADRAEREQELRLAQARANERARIAREMHDVLAHRISLVTMHAGALAYRTDLTAEELAKIAEVIQDNAHRALADLREILGILREDPGHDQPERPQPTLRDLGALIADEQQAGARIRLRDHAGQIDQMPESLGRTAYRIVQESLTNARKHAPGAVVDVIVTGTPGRSLVLVVRNPLPRRRPSGTPGAGLGLVGLAERAQLSGGRLDHRVTRNRHFVVHARLPWSP